VTPVRVTPLIDPDVTPASHSLVWLASGPGGVPVGSAFLRLFTRAGQRQLALLQLNLQPGERGTDTGFLLLDPALTAARGHCRSRVITHVEADSPGERFLAARGFRRVLTLISFRLALADADIAALSAAVDEPHPGYRLASWDGMVPDELAETFVASRYAMNDMPAGGIDFGVVPWDRQRIQAAVTAIEKQGDVLHTVVAVSAADGAIAGFTELAIPADGTGEAQSCGTAVLPGHRGHGLSRWMIAATMRHACERYPLLEGLRRDTADSNPYMTRVIDSLGYRPVHTTYEYQLDL
jgi:GNAT superfamily N-acetyltransferase